MNGHHELEMKAIATLRDASYDAFYHFHASSLARGVSVRVGRREARIEWISLGDYTRTPGGFNYTEAPNGFAIHAGSVMDEDSAMALIDFVTKLVGPGLGAAFARSAHDILVLREYLDDDSQARSGAMLHAARPPHLLTLSA